jgi:hypothetical protein
MNSVEFLVVKTTNVNTFYVLGLFFQRDAKNYKELLEQSCRE